jgi:tRNA pseudouridine38-40 synthase
MPFCLVHYSSKGQVALARSARTDAGVHAAVNALSLKLIVQPPGLPEPKELGTLVDYVNSFLPDHLRIWSITRVQGAFNPRGMCDSRCYDYLLPTYVFLPPKPDSAMGKALVEAGLSPFSDYQAKEGEPISLGKPSGWSLDDIELCVANVEASQFWSAVSQLPAVPTPENEEEESYFKQTMALKRQWRIGNSSTVLDDLKAATKLYEGNHNFHNFTIGMEFNSRSAIRIMKSLKASLSIDVFVN